MAEKSQVDLTPDPRVLRALTHTPLRPIDALCELIDNSIDAFHVAKRLGRPVHGALVLLTIPSRTDLAGGKGAVVIRDNGPGLTVADAEKALRAGFSGNNPFDTLGLFGMGFNIASGKIGMRTRFLTVHRDLKNELAVQITVDLPAMEKAGHYRVPVERVEAPENFSSGTMIEVSGWWPAGNPNADFIQKLASIPKAKLREEIGRRYATVLRRGEARILVNDEDCEAFEHCVWSPARSVDRQSWGRIPARFDINEVVGTQTRCSSCYSLLVDGEDCKECGPGVAKRTIEERIRGWVGVQRYDDADHFGIDLIRNGRSIRVLEKEAFFTFTDELGKKITDYPIDGPHGRIVGEVHLDHVPVDFMKQDFQRSSREWDQAMKYLRGESSLQPRQKGAEANGSPVFKLYQGYRRVRNVGKRDLYPGRWDSEQGAGVRISREDERALLQKFKARVPGYFEDAEWWKLVEEADQAPVPQLSLCPACGAQVLEHDEACQLCAAILHGKPCVACGIEIQKSATACGVCGVSQVPQLVEPWVCRVCGEGNPADEIACRQCAAPVGSRDPLSREVLDENSDLHEALSIQGLSVPLFDGTPSASFDLMVRKVRSPILVGGVNALPAYVMPQPQALTVFFDPSHDAFANHGFDITTFVAVEAAKRIYDERLALIAPSKGAHSVPRIASEVLKKFATSGPGSDLKERIYTFFRDLGEALNASNPQLIESLVVEMDEATERDVVAAVQAAGRPLSDYHALALDGSLVAFMPPHFIAAVFKRYPDKFFEGKVFTEHFSDIAMMSDAALSQVRAEAHRVYGACLDDCAQFVSLRRSSRALSLRARHALEFLERGMA